MLFYWKGELHKDITVPLIWILMKRSGILNVKKQKIKLQTPNKEL